MKDHLKEYLRYKKLCKLQPAPLRNYKNHLTKFKNASESLKIPLDDRFVTKQHIMKYLHYYKKHVKSIFVLDSSQSILLNYYTFLYERGYIDKPIEPIPRRRLPQRVPPHLTLNEAIRVIKYLSKNRRTSKFYWFRNKLIVYLILTYGLRLREVLNIRINSINLKKKKIFIKGCVIQQKRYLPLTAPMLETIKRYLKVRENIKSHKLIIQHNGKEDKNGTSNCYIRTIARYAGIKKTVSAITLRNTFISLLSSVGINGKTTQAILGQHTLKSIENKLHKLTYSSNIL